MSETGVGGYGEPEIGDEVAEGIAKGNEEGAKLPDYAQPQEGSEADESSD